MAKTTDDLIDRLHAVKCSGSDANRAILDAAEEIGKLREAIYRIADEDALLSVSGGNLFVHMDGTLTEDEEDIIKRIVDDRLNPLLASDARTLRAMLQRLGTKNG